MDQNAQSQQQTQSQPAPSEAAAPAPVQPQSTQFGDQIEPTEKHVTMTFEEDLKFFVTQETVDDMRFFDLYATVSENEFKVPEIIKFMIGPEKYDSIFKYYEARGQKFKISKFMSVFQQLDKDLNSDPDFLSR